MPRRPRPEGRRRGELRHSESVVRRAQDSGAGFVPRQVPERFHEDDDGMTTPLMIEAQGLSKQYGSFLAVRDVTFSIPKGQVVAFLGPNGAGKTTTMRLLTGFVAPTRGVARIAGIDVQSNRIEAAEHLGYLPENGPLYPDMTPHGLLQFFGEARGLSGGRLRQRAEAVLAQCSLESVAHKPIGKLSK